MKIKTLGIALLMWALATPGWAESKSVTVKVSCYIPPAIEIASQARASHPVEVRTGLEKRYQMSDHFCMRGKDRVRLYTITAL